VSLDFEMPLVLERNTSFIIKVQNLIFYCETGFMYLKIFRRNQLELFTKEDQVSKYLSKGCSLTSKRYHFICM